MYQKLDLREKTPVAGMVIMSKRFVACDFCKREEIVDTETLGCRRQWREGRNWFPFYWCEECRAIHEEPYEALERKYRVEYVDLKNVPVREYINLVGEEWIRKNQTVPFGIDPDFSWLMVAMVNPFDLDAEQELKTVWSQSSSKGRLSVYVCDQESFDNFLLRAYPKDEDDAEKKI